MRAVLGFILIGAGLWAISSLFYSSNTPPLPVVNAQGSGGMSVQSSWNNLTHSLQANDRYASRGMR